MANVIEELLIKISTDSKGVEKGATNAVKTAAGAIKNALGTFVAPIFTAFISGAFIKQTYQEVINLDHLSTSLGVNVERLQMWQGAAKDAGSSAEAVGAMWMRMNAQIVDAATNGTGILNDFAVKGVLPALKTVDGKIKDTDTYLLELSDALHKMDAQTASGIGRKLGIRDYNLLNFLQQGSGEINQQLNHIKQLGVYTKEDVLIARDFDVALNDVTRVMKMGLVPIFRLVTPLISKIGMAFVYLSQHSRAFVPVGLAVAALIVKSLIPSIILLGKELRKLMMNPVALKIMAVLAVLVAVGLAIEDIMVWMEGGESVIGEYLGSWEEFKPKIQPAIDIITEFIGILKDVGSAFLEFEASAIKAAISAGKALYDNFVAPALGWFGKLIDYASRFWNTLGRIADKIRGIDTGALNISGRGGGGSFDNSSHATNVENNITVNGVKDGEQAARLVADRISSVPAFDGAMR